MDYAEILLSIDVTDAGTEGRDTWLRLSMAAKAAGVPYEIWNEWCRGDPTRYHEGKNRKVWDSISTDEGITAGTLVKYAEDHGYWTPEGHPIEDWILYDGDELQNPRKCRTATEQAVLYLETLFRSDDIVGYNLSAEYDERRDKWTPCTAGSYHYTAGQIIADLLRRIAFISPDVDGSDPEHSQHDRSSRSQEDHKDRRRSDSPVHPL